MNEATTEGATAPARLEAPVARSWAAEVRAFTGTWTLCVAPWVFVFGFIDVRAFWAAMASGVTLWLSALPVPPRRRQ